MKDKIVQLLSHIYEQHSRFRKKKHLYSFYERNLDLCKNFMQFSCFKNYLLTTVDGTDFPLHVGHRVLPKLFNVVAAQSSTELGIDIFLAGTD